jgi:hypothetical protein
MVVNTRIKKSSEHVPLLLLVEEENVPEDVLFADRVQRTNQNGSYKSKLPVNPLEEKLLVNSLLQKLLVKVHLQQVVSKSPTDTGPELLPSVKFVATRSQQSFLFVSYHSKDLCVKSRRTSKLISASKVLLC